MRTLGRSLALLFVAGFGILATAGEKKACQATLAQCPQQGCAKQDTPDALSNIAKHNLAPAGKAKTLSFADFKDLQGQVEKLFAGKYSKLTKPDRARLRHLKAGGQSLGEGDLVEIVAFIAMRPEKSEPHANTSGESVNCRLPKSENNDFHISLTPSSNGSEYEGIVVEMIPQKRNATWTEALLHTVQNAHRQVRARGQLFFDNHHKVNDDESHSLGNQPKRMSLWEVHPVTRFEVCAAQTCTTNGGGWKALEDWKGGSQ